jgi:hypothetical protein
MNNDEWKIWLKSLPESEFLKTIKENIENLSLHLNSKKEQVDSYTASTIDKLLLWIKVRGD